MNGLFQRLLRPVLLLVKQQAEPFIALLVGIALLGACAVAPPVAPLANTPWAARQAALNALRQWSAVGRIAVVNDQDGWHASLSWVQQGPDYAIELLGPFGQGRVSIQGNPQGVSLQTADGRFLSAADPDQLLQDTIGVRIPVSGLMYWVRGVPDPAQPSELAGDEQGRLTRLEQGGWVIDYPAYGQVAALELPTRIQAQRDQIKVKLVIEQWNLDFQ